MADGNEQDWVDADVPAESRRKRFRLRKPNAQLITSAKRTPDQNRKSREKQYLILQLSRVPFILISMAFAFTGHWALATIFFIISVPLPWIAVVIANGKGEVRDKRTQNVYLPAAARQAAMEAERRAALEAGSSGETENPEDSEPTTIDHEDFDHKDDPTDD